LRDLLIHWSLPWEKHCRWLCGGCCRCCRFCGGRFCGGRPLRCLRGKEEWVLELRCVISGVLLEVIHWRICGGWGSRRERCRHCLGLCSRGYRGRQRCSRLCCWVVLGGLRLMPIWVPVEERHQPGIPLVELKGQVCGFRWCRCCCCCCCC